MKALLKKSAILKTISSKISTYLHAIDADPQEDDSDFDDVLHIICHEESIHPPRIITVDRDVSVLL